MSVPTPNNSHEAERKVFRKTGWIFRLRREVKALEYVRKHTSIPVPRILDTCLVESRVNAAYDDEGCIDMTRIYGQQLGEA
jgi:hypothetical protein